jgi:hypothetical protein
MSLMILMIVDDMTGGRFGKVLSHMIPHVCILKINVRPLHVSCQSFVAHMGSMGDNAHLIEFN